MATHRSMTSMTRAMLRVLALLTVPGIAACDPTEPSEQGQWSLHVGLRDHLGEREQPSLVLIGSQFNVDLARQRTASEELEVTPELAACVPLSASGSLILSEGEFVAYDVGIGSVQIPAPTDACPDLTGEAASLTADSWSVEVATDPGFAVWSLWFEQALGGLSPGPAGQFPAELGRILGANGAPAPGREVRVAAGGTFQLDPVLVEDQTVVPPAEVREIRWSGREAELTSDHEDLLAREFDDDASPTRLFGRVELDDPQASEIITTLFSIGLADNAQNLGVAAWPNMPQVEVVPTDQITQLELVPVYNPGDSERDWAEPIGVIALAHDAQGRRVIAPPVEWRQTEGDLAAHEQGPTDVSDVLLVDDICRERPEQPEGRTATIEARLGELVASTDLEWTALAEGPTPKVDSELCAGDGCSCSVDADPQGSIAALFGLLGLFGLRRRRGL